MSQGDRFLDSHRCVSTIVIEWFIIISSYLINIFHIIIYNIWKFIIILISNFCCLKINIFILISTTSNWITWT